MPSFRIVLAKKNTVYNLHDEIDNQYDEGPVSTASTWPLINVQSDYDNVNAAGESVYIKVGDSELSGLRYGRKLAPGEVLSLALGGAAKGVSFVSTKSVYLLCEDIDGAQVSVQLIGGTS